MLDRLVPVAVVMWFRPFAAMMRMLMVLVMGMNVGMKSGAVLMYKFVPFARRPKQSGRCSKGEDT